VGETSDILIWDYLLQNSDRAGNCLGARHPTGETFLQLFDNEDGQYDREHRVQGQVATSKYPASKFIGFQRYLALGENELRPEYCLFRRSTKEKMETLSTPLLPSYDEKNQMISEVVSHDKSDDNGFLLFSHMVRQSLLHDKLATQDTPSQLDKVIISNKKVWNYLDKRIQRTVAYVHRCIQKFGEDVVLL